MIYMPLNDLFTCAACLAQYNRFDRAAECCMRLKIEAVKLESTDTHCQYCRRFIPAGFGCRCHPKEEAKRANYYREYYQRNREKKLQQFKDNDLRRKMRLYERHQQEVQAGRQIEEALTI